MEEVPPHWTLLRLEELTPADAPIVYGIVQPGPHVPDGVPFIRPADIDDATVRLQELPRTSKEIAKKYQRSALKEGDLVFSVVGTIGKWFIVPPELDGANITQSSVRIRPLKPLEARFYLRALESPFVRSQIRRLTFGNAVQRLNVAHVRSLQIPTPPLSEQRRIVEKLDQLTARSRRARETLDAVPRLLEKLRQSILAAAFRGDLTADWRAKNPNVESADRLLGRIRAERRERWEDAERGRLAARTGSAQVNGPWKAKYAVPSPVGEACPVKLPSTWCWATAEELTDAYRPIIYGIIKAGPDVPGGVPYVRVTEVAAGRIVLSELPRCDPARAAKFKRSILVAGDILVSKDGTIGKVALVPPELEGGNINQHVLRVAASRFVCGPYLARMIESPYCQRWMTGEVRGVALQGVNVADFRRMPIPLAPEAEQREIVAVLAMNLTRIATLSAAVADAASRIGDLDASILSKAFRGDLVPQAASDEPASVLLARVRSSRGGRDLQAPRLA